MKLTEYECVVKLPKQKEYTAQSMKNKKMQQKSF